MAEKKDVKPGVGLDCGTMNLVAVRSTKKGALDTKKMRNAFLDLDSDAKNTLRMSKVEFYQKEDSGQLIVLGDSALKFANLFQREIRRPLARGLMASGEMMSQEVLSMIIYAILGEPVVAKEHCYYSIPAAPLDEPNQDVVYHREILKKIISEHGYTAHPVNEALAIVYSQCASTGFSGIAASYGSGMTNVALAFQAVEGMTFSVARGGDYVDAQAAKAVGSTAAKICALKENGVDLRSNNLTREQEALKVFLRELIAYSLTHITKQFQEAQNKLSLSEPIPFIVSGGTSKAPGFMEVFQEEYEKAVKKRGFPIKISEIRQAEDPLDAVAQGLAILASQEYD